MTEEETDIKTDRSFKEIAEELEESLVGTDYSSEQGDIQPLTDDQAGVSKPDESFDEIATDLGISIVEHERLDQKEAEQEMRRLDYQERAKVLSEQERLQDEQEAQLSIKQREQELRAQTIREQEERQRLEEERLASQEGRSPVVILIGMGLGLLFVGVVAMSGGYGDSSSHYSTSNDLSNRSYDIVTKSTSHLSINESNYTLGENETVHAWTLEEFDQILIPEARESNIFLEDFVEKYGLASQAHYEKSSNSFDSLTLTYTLSETEYLKFDFWYRSGTDYRLYSKEYKGFENTILTDYWKDKVGKSWTLADYHALTQAKKADEPSLEDIITKFGAPTSYTTSATSYFYRLTLDYLVEDGTTLKLTFSSKTNQVADYNLDYYSIKTEENEATE